MMQRTPGWRGRLLAYLAASARRPFEPGAHDGALFAAGAVEAMTGVDLAAEWRGRYTTVAGGVRVLRKAGFADAVAVAEAHFRRRADGERARPGDVAVIDEGGVPAMGIVQGLLVYVLRPDGIGIVPLTRAVTVFEVP